MKKVEETTSSLHRYIDSFHHMGDRSIRRYGAQRLFFPSLSGFVNNSFIFFYDRDANAFVINHSRHQTENKIK
jgi:hypothetical protein